MPRTTRWAAAAAAALALALTACGSSSDDAALGSGDAASSAEAAPSGNAPAPSAQAATCPLTAKSVPPPAGVGTDLGQRPKVPANSGAPATEVQVADVVVGTGAEAATGSPVTVKYVGAIDKTGKEFDASWNRGADDTLPFTACGQEVVPGFSISPIGMKVGGRRLVRIPDQFGYPGGNPQAGIAAGDVITFVIDLVKVG